MKFRQCSQCKRCCHNPADKIFKVQLTNKEQGILQCSEIRMMPHSICPFMNNGCTAEVKPFICRYYPYFIRDNNIYFDISCPLKDFRKLCILKNELAREYETLTDVEKVRISSQYAEILPNI